MSGREAEILEWLAQQRGAPRRVRTGIGDDMAILEIQGRTVLLGTDMLLDGVHFDSARHSFEQIGHKALACCLSDCAAMACRPAAAAVSWALPPQVTVTDVQRLFSAMRLLGEAFDCPVVGGDTTTWSGRLVIDVVMLGEPWPDVAPVLRRGARPGDRIIITGPTGGSLLGRHLAFTPRVREAYRLAASLGTSLHALIDISDGVALDLYRVCQASGTGALLDEAAMQAMIHPDARRAASEDGRSPLDHALHDGEDFELLACVDPQAEIEHVDCGVPLLVIGEITAEGFMLRGRDGAQRPLEPRGYLHA